MPCTSAFIATTKCGSRRDKEHPKVCYGKPAFHALEVRPYATERVHAEQIGDESYNSKDGHTDSQRIYLWSVSRIIKSQDYPGNKTNLNQNAEIKSLTCDEREEERLNDNERK